MLRRSSGRASRAVCHSLHHHETLLGDTRRKLVSEYEITPMNIEKMIEHAALLRNCKSTKSSSSLSSQSEEPFLWTRANEVQHEVRVRIAHCLAAFDAMPASFQHDRHFSRVHANTWHWFALFCRMNAVKSEDGHRAFLKQVREFEIKERPVLPDIATGLGAYQKASKHSVEQYTLDKFLHYFCVSRMGWRLLFEDHHLLSSTGTTAFCSDMNPTPIAFDAFARVRDISFEQYGVKPPFIVDGDSDATLPYVPSHLSYTLSELIKNSMRATVEHHKEAFHKRGAAALPPVRLNVMSDANRITLVLSDEGGGIPEQDEGTVWRFGWSTMPTSCPAEIDECCEEGGCTADCGRIRSERQHQQLLAGWGCGLPLSRCYVQHFGGTMRLHSKVGEGVDVYIELPKRGVEKLPLMC